MGICDVSGLVLGLMPHPERFLRWTQHPTWTRLSKEEQQGDPLGLQMFKNAVKHVTQKTANCVEQSI
jgi:phosphoribosylformylglycinamidine synthase